jgi:hypothetical protein
MSDENPPSGAEIHITGTTVDNSEFYFHTGPNGNRAGFRTEDRKLRIEGDDNEFTVNGIRSRTLGWLLIGGTGAALVAGYVLHAIVNGGN